MCIMTNISNNQMQFNKITIFQNNNIYIEIFLSNNTAKSKKDHVNTQVIYTYYFSYCHKILVYLIILFNMLASLNCLNLLYFVFFIFLSVSNFALRAAVNKYIFKINSLNLKLFFFQFFLIT